MIGVIRRTSHDFLFQTEGGWAYPLLLPRGFARRPRFLDERHIIEALYTPEGWLMLVRQLPIGYDVRRPPFVGFRMILMLLGIE